MTRFFIALAAGVATMGSLAAVHAGAQPMPQHAAPRTISATAEGKPILLKRMTVTATALPDAN